MSKFTPEFLWNFRNNIKIRKVIKKLGILTKESEGFTRFLCPQCCDFNTSIHPAENLGRCFKCKLMPSSA